MQPLQQLFSSPPNYVIPIELTYASDGDSNGVLYWIGTTFGTTSWSNPAVGSPPLAKHLRSSDHTGVVSAVADRAIEVDGESNSDSPSWVAVDLGSVETLAVNKYLLHVTTGRSRTPKDFKLQGINTLSSWDVTGVNAATWTDIDIRTGQSVSGYGSFVPNVVNPSAPYRYLRLAQTANNGGDNRLIIDEWEIYGSFFY